MLIGYLFSDPLIFVVWAFAFLLALSFHEFSHALVGNLLGGQTAKRMGRLTLNPVAHIDPLGLFAVLMIGFGWGKPVPFNPYNLKWPKWGPVAVAFAGPLSNLLLAIVAIVVLSVVGVGLGAGNLLVIFLGVFAQLNVMLMVFNLVPLPPLDGSKALLALLSHPKYSAARLFIETRGPQLLLFLVLADAVTGAGIFSRLIGWAFRLVASLATFQSYL